MVCTRSYGKRRGREGGGSGLIGRRLVTIATPATRDELGHQIFEDKLILYLRIYFITSS
jgi:hypothetical protein